MDFSLSPEQQAMVEQARAFTKEWISPRAVEHDRSGEFPLEICREAFKQGFMNPHIPTEYGGAAHAVLDHCLVMEELCTGCSGIATAIDANGLSQYPVIFAGKITTCFNRRLYSCMFKNGINNFFGYFHIFKSQTVCS